MNTDKIMALFDEAALAHRKYREVRDGNESGRINLPLAQLQALHARADETRDALRAAVEQLERERDRYKEVLHYLRSELLHSDPKSYYGALWRAINVALFPEEKEESK